MNNSMVRNGLGSMLDENNKRSEIIVCDWDAVVQLIEEPWFNNLLYLRKVNPTHKLSLTVDFSKFTNEKGLIDHKKVMSRNRYYLTDWIAYDNEKLDEEAFNEFMKLYNDDLSVYNRAPFLNMFHAIHRLATEKFCKKVIFLSHTAGDDIERDERKQLLFNKIFLEPRRASKFNANLQLVHLKPSQKKHDWIKQNVPDYTMFIDDRFDIIEGVIDNTDSEGKTFCMPIMGYNISAIANNIEVLEKLRKVEFLAYDQQITQDLSPVEFFEKDEDIFVEFPF